MRILSFIIVFLIISNQFTFADIKSAREALRNKDYDTARKEFLLLAEEGDSNALFSLGQLYGQGLGVEKNMETAFKWSKKAADAGQMFAAYTVAMQYITGNGVDKDIALANHYMEKSANAGFINAYGGLVQIALSQEPKRYTVARTWLERLLEKKDDNSWLRIVLAEMYRLGQGGPVDIPSAIELLENGISDGDPAVMYTLAQVLSNENTPFLNDLPEALAMYYISEINGFEPKGDKKENSEKRASTDQIIEAYKRLSAYYEASAKFRQMEIDGNKNFGLEMTVSQMIKNYPKALEQLVKGVQNGSIEATHTIYKAYKDGIGIEPDLNKAIYWHQILFLVDRKKAGRAPNDPLKPMLTTNRNYIKSDAGKWLDNYIGNFGSIN